MPRPAIATPEQIRSTILSMLTDAHDAAPASRERFRRVVSVRKLQARLGGGDPAALGRAINAVEAEVVAAGIDQIAIPELPPDVSDLMRQLWQAAVGVQLDEVAKLKREAMDVAENAKAAMNDSALRVEVLKAELSELRGLLAARDTDLAQARADRGALSQQLQALQAEHEALREALAAAHTHTTAQQQVHAKSLAETQQRYDGLSKQLMQETAQQRQALQQEQNRIGSQLKFAERRIATLEEAIAEAQRETVHERDQRQAAVGEANALKAINASQRVQLDEIVRATLAPPPAPKQRAPRTVASKTISKGAGVRKTKP
ncbi:DNA-binding protein [Herbaspirillum sp. RV1423]|uniref:DNA-binding protein n=1 Tax=Herbaspirillum sp. RV1423 TaxID=1443993 RepID=UPI0004B3D5B6|nr:DNA-binding protein [Herbaspirillum sp. RV1423]